MSTDLFANRIASASGGAVAVPLREMLGYDPFRRFLPNVDPEMEVVRTENGWDVETRYPAIGPNRSTSS
jgi:hypothetical protein